MSIYVYQIFNSFARLVEKHVEYEARLIEKIEKILPEIDDEKVKFVLNAILADEKRHHRLLKKVLEVLIKAETISPDEWWGSNLERCPLPRSARRIKTR